MKYKYFKTLAIILIGIISFSITTDVSAETITGELTNHGLIELQDEQSWRMAGTHVMTVKIDGKEYSAYCAWYENKSPESGTYTFEPVSLNNKNVAVGLDSILSATMPGYTANEIRVIKTTAINLFLSINGELAGKTCSKEANRFDDSNWYTSKFYQKYGNSPHTILATFEHSYGNKYELKVAELVKNAQQIADNYVQPTITFLDDDSSYQLKNGYYVKIYKVTTNNIDNSTLSAEVEGLTEEEKKQVIFSTRNNSITVKIPQKIYEKLENNKISVVVNAEATYNEAKIYIATNQDRCDYQDLVFPKYNVKRLKVSTKDVIKLNRCITYETVCDSTSCDNTNSNNERQCFSYTKVEYKTTCDTTDNSVRESGKHTADLISGKCSLYCKERATVSYPGNVRPAITLDTNFTWPTTTIEDGYPLLTESTLSCKIEMNNGENVTQDCIDAANKFEYKKGSSTATLIYNDTEENNSIPLKEVCATTTKKINYNQIEIKNNCYYTLPSNKNIAVNKKTVEFVNKVASDASDNTINDILINKYHGVLPVGGITGNINFSKTQAAKIFNSTYKLQIANMPLGYDGQFTTKVNSSDYICNYKVTDVQPVHCDCPPGTKNVGKDLSDKVGSATTCAEAREIYCNIDDTDKYCNYKGKDINITECLKTNTEAVCIEKYCPSDERLYCTKPSGEKVDITDCFAVPVNTLEICEIAAGCTKDNGLCPPESKHPERDYKACVFGGMSETDCIQLICYDDPCTDNCDYVCPENSDYPNKDISNCVNFERGKGNNLENSISACQKRYCYKGGNGIIIYRTISLENPFPSMDADKNITQKDLTVGMFNDTVKGRYPGTNWNGITLVKNKILNNRGYDGSAIYQEADPLYVIELDATAIKKIRDYNSYQVEHSEGYADFTLTCTNGAYCRSSFLRDGRYTKADGKQILTGGTCQSVDGKDSFVNCYETKKG